MLTIYKKQRKDPKTKKTGDSRYNYQNKLDKPCFQYDTAHGDFKDLTRKIASDKILRDKVFNVAKNLKYDGCQRGLASLVFKLFNKKVSGAVIKNENMSNKELAEELQNQSQKN